MQWSLGFPETAPVIFIRTVLRQRKQRSFEQESSRFLWWNFRTFAVPLTNLCPTQLVPVDYNELFRPSLRQRKKAQIANSEETAFVTFNLFRLLNDRQYKFQKLGKFLDISPKQIEENQRQSQIITPFVESKLNKENHSDNIYQSKRQSEPFFIALWMAFSDLKKAKT